MFPSVEAELEELARVGGGLRGGVPPPDPRDASPELSSVPLAERGTVSGRQDVWESHWLRDRVCR